MSNSSDRHIDYTAIARSAVNSSDLPSWLAIGQLICAPKYAQGTGKITAILGERLIAKFPNYSVPVLITNWREEINLKQIFPPPIKGHL